MEANFREFRIDDSEARLNEILASAESFEELDDIPPRDRLTFTNGFNVKCTSLFIDIRGSSQLSKFHTRPVLGKIYRAYLSECVAILNSDERCREVFIAGDCVHGIFSTRSKDALNGVFDTAAKLSSVIALLNFKLEASGYTPIVCGIGMAHGRALMLKAGYKGSTINDVIWMGDVVNEASKLCHDGSRGERLQLQISPTVYENLSTNYQRFFQAIPQNLLMGSIAKYEGNVHNIAMQARIEELRLARVNRQVMASALARSNGIFGSIY